MACVTLYLRHVKCEAYSPRADGRQKCGLIVRLYLRVSDKIERHSWHWRCLTHKYAYGKLWPEAIQWVIAGAIERAVEQGQEPLWPT